ncbi:alpha-L-fucosidase [Arcanobacterium phocae]|uniref:alpha-L-fucosidase n=1 Tax=Arcanobacterium phocae TaxID=131112 RepID=UPI001C0F1CEC
MLNFDERVGNRQDVSYPPTPVPQWYRDAKVGLMIHWGIYSIPAWAVTSDEHFSLAEEYAFHRYAEWYGNTVRIPGSPTALLHRARYGQRSYEDLVDIWQIRDDAVANMVNLAVRAGARYVVPTTKHHDGLCLWNTQTTDFSTVKRGPGVDIIGQYGHAVRQAGLRLGLYFSGALDWHASNFGPITSDNELFAFRRNDPDFAQYAATQLRELIDIYHPDYIWNDIDWPDGGKGPEPYGLSALFTQFFQTVPNGVINDRWGVQAQGVLTREYRDVLGVMDRPWEAVRGLGKSFGYNADEDVSVMLSGPDLVRYLVDVVAKNGNLLINIGPKADGTVPDIQQQSLEYMGQWLRVFGEGIYGTRPWGPGLLDGCYFTCSTGADDVVYVLYEPDREVVLPEKLRDRKIIPLGSGDGMQWPIVVAKLVD